VFGGRLVDVLMEVVEGFTLESPVSSGVRSIFAEYTFGNAIFFSICVIALRWCLFRSYGGGALHKVLRCFFNCVVSLVYIGFDP